MKSVQLHKYTELLMYLQQDNEQFEEAFMKFFYRSDNVEPNILVCHANIIRYFICRYFIVTSCHTQVNVLQVFIAYRCLQVTTSAWKRVAVSHCSITKIRINANGTTTLCNLNMTDHLHL